MIELQAGRTRDRITRGKARQNKEIEEIPRRWKPHDLRVVRHCSPGRLPNAATTDGRRRGNGRSWYIEFNAHCYQRREDATQPHCLAGLVTAGDIINRRARAHIVHSFFLPLDVVAKRMKACGREPESERTKGKGVENIVFYIGKHRRFLVIRAGFRAALSNARVRWNSRGVLFCRARSPLHLSDEWICTRSRSIYGRGETTNGKTKNQFLRGFECRCDSTRLFIGTKMLPLRFFIHLTRVSRWNCLLFTSFVYKYDMRILYIYISHYKKYIVRERRTMLVKNKSQRINDREKSQGNFLTEKYHERWSGSPDMKSRTIQVVPRE